MVVLKLIDRSNVSKCDSVLCHFSAAWLTLPILGGLR